MPKNKNHRKNSLKQKAIVYLHYIKHKWSLFALIGLCFILLVSHTLYVLRTYQYPAAGLDEHTYLSMALHFHDILQKPSINSISEIINFERSRQPLYGIFLALPLLFLGTDHMYKISLWINIIFYLTTIITTYFLGKEFFSRKASFLAAFIFAFYGFPLFYLHFTYSETAVTSFVALSLLFLKKSQNFSKLKQTMLFSIFFTLGNLTRWVTPILLAGPLILSSLLAIKRQFSPNTKNIRITSLNILIFLLIGIFPVLLLFYIPNLSFFSVYVSGNKTNELQWASQWLGPEYRNLFSISSLTFYLTIFAQQTIFFFTLFLVGCLLQIIYFKRYAFLITTFIVAYLIFTFGSTWKGDRFIVPLYPIIVLISATVFDFLKSKRILIPLIMVTIVLSLLNFFGGVWGMGPMKFSITGDTFTVPHSILVSMPVGHPRRIWFAPISWPPRSNEGNTEVIAQTLIKNWRNPQKTFNILYTFEIAQIGTYVWRYEKPNMALERSFMGIQKDNYYDFFTLIDNQDYVVVKNGIIDNGIKEGESKEYDTAIYFTRKFNKAMQLPNAYLPNAFIKIADIKIPFDGSTLLIYRKQRQVRKEEWEKFAHLFITLDPPMNEKIEKAAQDIAK